MARRPERAGTPHPRPAVALSDDATAAGSPARRPRGEHLTPDGTTPRPLSGAHQRAARGARLDWRRPGRLCPEGDGQPVARRAAPVRRSPRGLPRGPGQETSALTGASGGFTPPRAHAVIANHEARPRKATRRRRLPG